MMRFISNKKTLLSWLWVVLCSLVIFSIVPVGRAIQVFVSNKWGRVLFGYFVLAVLFIGFSCLIYYLIFMLKLRTPSNYLWLISIFSIYIYFTLKLWKIPEEAVHFLEYGLLGFFLFKALSHHIKDKSIYITATLFALLVGIFDEILQWIVPQRGWDFRDVGLNVLSGGLFELAVCKVVKPKIISEKISAKSLKIFSLVFSVCLILLGLCVSNTPQRVVRYTKRIPILSFLQKEESMSEFGYKYNDSEIGVFYSRLSPKRLQKTDEQRGDKYAQILNESVDKNYEQFLREYNPAVNPFLHELRVHIFRRDSYFEKANKTDNLKKKKEFYLIAYKENLIMSKYFTQTIKNSAYWWEDKRIKKIKELIDENKPYVSPVSASLFTSFSEKEVWITIFTIISLMILMNLILLRKKRERST